MQWKSLRFQRLILAKWQVWGRLGSNVICSKDNSATAIHHTACVVCTEYTIKEVGVLKKNLETAYMPWPISAESIVTESNFQLCFDLQMPCRYMYCEISVSVFPRSVHFICPSHFRPFACRGGSMQDFRKGGVVK